MIEFVNRLELGKRKFNIILGNPPYQDGTKGRSCNPIQLWPKFMEQAMYFLKDDGLLCFIHPPAYRRPEHELYPKWKKHNILYLSIHSKKEGIKNFGASTLYDWYILQKSDYKGKTTIKDINGNTQEINLNEWKYFLPSGEYKLIKSIMGNEGDVYYSRSDYAIDRAKTKTIYDCIDNLGRLTTKKEKTKIFKYPVIYMILKGKGLCLYYSNIKRENQFGVSKVIIALTGWFQGILNDYKGEYGCSQFIFYLKTTSKEHGEEIIEALNSEKFKRIWNSIQWLPMTREWRFFKYIKKDWYKEFLNDNNIKETNDNHT